MDAVNPIHTIWGYRWWLLAFASTVSVLVFLLSSQSAPSYDASAVIQVVSGRQAANEFVAQEELVQLTSFFAELARSTTVEKLTAAQLQPDVENPVLATAVRVAPRGQLQILDVTASSGDRETAAQVANAYAEAFSTYVDQQQDEERLAGLERIQERTAEIQGQLSAAPADSAALEAELAALQQRAADLQVQFRDSARVIQPAVAPDAPASPKPLRNAVLAFIAALVIGAGAAYARSALTDRYATAEEVAADLNLPALATVPRAASESAEAVEAFRILRTSVSYALREHVGPVLMVTSATPGSGKTHISINMAQSFSGEGRRVILVDCDFRRPAINKRLPGIPEKPGMADLVTRPEGIPELNNGHLPLWSLPVPGGGEYLDVMPAGSSVVDPAAALTTDRAEAVFASLSQQYDLAVIDSPPTLPVVDPLVIAHYSDGVLFVVDARRDRRSDVRRAVETLRAIDAPIIGFVFNSATVADRRYSYDDQRGAHEAPAVRVGP